MSMSQTEQIALSFGSQNAMYRAPSKESTFRFVFLVVLCEKFLSLKNLDIYLKLAML